MPVSQTFNSYAPMPNLAGAGEAARAGVRQGIESAASTQLKRQALRQQQEESNAQLQQRQQMLAQEQQKMQMAMQAQQAEQERKRIKDQQDAEIQKAYNAAQLGLREQDLKRKEEELQFKTQQAAQSYASRQRFQGLIQGGMDPSKAIFQEPGVVPSGAYTAAMRPPQQPFIPKTTEVNGKTYIQTSPNQWRLADVPERLGSIDNAKLQRLTGALKSVDAALMNIKQSKIMDEDTQRIRRELEAAKVSLEKQMEEFGEPTESKKKRYSYKPGGSLTPK